MDISKKVLTKIKEKAKERTVKTQSIEYDLETLVKKIDRETIKLDPGYQRRHRWTVITSSRLIESLILNIPIPTIYLSLDIDVDTESEDSRYSIIDGQQRVTAIYGFFNNKYKLTGLEALNDLNGFYYQDLPPFLIRRLEERTIKCLRIDSTVDSRVKIDIFERLNSGSIKLEAQELRNAVYMGPFNDLCKQLSTEEGFQEILQNKKVAKMEDVELVLRFYALIDDKYKSFKKSKDYRFTDFLSDELEKGNSLSNEELNKFKDSFSRTIETILKSFGPQAFAKYKFENGNFRLQSRLNAAVYDSLAIAIYSEIILKDKNVTEKMVDDFKKLFKNERFHESVSGSILDSTKIVYRIDKARKVFRQ